MSYVQSPYSLQRLDVFRLGRTFQPCRHSSATWRGLTSPAAMFVLNARLQITLTTYFIHWHTYNRRLCYVLSFGWRYKSRVFLKYVTVTLYIKQLRYCRESRRHANPVNRVIWTLRVYILGNDYDGHEPWRLQPRRYKKQSSKPKQTSPANEVIEVRLGIGLVRIKPEKGYFGLLCILTAAITRNNIYSLFTEHGSNDWTTTA